MAKTTDLIAALRCSSSVPSAQLDCRTCAFHMEETVDGKDYAGCECDRILVDAADKIEELVDRCARYAEEIAVLQGKQKWVDAGARQPEYGVPVLAVASGKAGNITLCDAVVFATAYDGWELDDYPQAEDVTVKWWMPIVESPEGVCGGMEHE